MADVMNDDHYFTSPTGRAVYPKLEPGNPDTKFDDDGVYVTQLRISGPEAQGFKQAIDDLAQALGRHLVENEDSFSADDDIRRPYEEEDDGSILFKAKMKASGTTRDGETWEREPKLFDASGTPCPDVEIGGGSEIRVAGSMNPYFVKGPIGAGISLKLTAVQIISLEEYAVTADTYGFDSVEDGFDASGDEATEDSSDAEGDSPNAEEDFDF